jgi:Rps23 Pro-64 3,4-dihydroxylase Tpa1-like proline 4-hydroxylase
MKYYNISKNIIACKNFLPSIKVDELYTDFLNNRTQFNIPNWRSENYNDSKEFFSPSCGGFDFWINWKEAKKGELFITAVGNWVLTQGLRHYASDNNLPFFSLLERNVEWNVHVISYNNGGYYGWHKDNANSNLFTFNLIFNKGNKLKGGNMLFMDEGKIIEVPNENNFFCVFPSFISHAITPLYSEDNKEVSFLEQRFSVQFWTSLAGVN